MLFYHQITCIFMIYVYLLQKFVVAIYAVFPPIVLAWKLDSANVFTFRMYVLHDDSDADDEVIGEEWQGAGHMDNHAHTHHVICSTRPLLPLYCIILIQMELFPSHNVFCSRAIVVKIAIKGTQLKSLQPKLQSVHFMKYECMWKCLCIWRRPLQQNVFACVTHKSTL